MTGLQRFLRLVAAFACGTVVAAALAQSIGTTPSGLAESSDAVSRGAQAYAQGDRPAAIALLADAIRRDPHDPRPYYLRALCLARSGHPAEARADLVVAAALETRNPDQYPVDGTIARLAVADRTLLNQFRWRSHTEDFARAFDEGLIPAGVHPVPAVSSDAGVLRQKASVPLDQLTKPISLSELASVASRQPAAIAVETGSDPFSDDPAPAATADHAAAVSDADPFAEPAVERTDTSTATHMAPAEPADPFAAAEQEASAPSAAGKIPSNKLFGIFRRVVSRAAPVPSLDSVRDQLPNLPIPGAAAPPAAGADPFGSAVEPAAFNEGSPFDEQPAATDAQSPDAEAAQAPPAEAEPAAASEEDPFG